MTKKELIKALKDVDEDTCLICKDTFGGWDNIIRIESYGAKTAIIFGGGSPFTNE